MTARTVTPTAATGPWWVRTGRGTVRAYRAARGLPVHDGPPRMALVMGEDGMPTYVPVVDKPPRVVAAGRWAWRHRRTVAPLIPAASAWVGRHADLGWSPTLAAVGVFTFAALAAWVVWIGRSDTTRATRLGIVATVMAIDLWWVLGMPPTGLAVMTATSMAYMAWRFRIRPMAVIQVDDPDVDWRFARWAEHVEGRLLPGAQLAGLDDLESEDGEPIGWVAGVQMVPGVHEVADLRAKVGKIAGLYGAAKAGTTVEEADDESRAILIVTVRRFLAEAREWRGPSLDTTTGRFVLQTLADGSRGHWEVWKPREGVRHGWVAGSTGSGKSGSADAILGSVMSAGVCLLDLVDLKQGASLPHWKVRALRSSDTVAGAIRALRRANAFMDLRYLLMKSMPAVDDDGQPVVIDGHPALGVSSVDPSPDWPVWLLFIEEFPELATNPVAIALAERIVRLGRQAGVALYLTSQGTNLDAVFGSSAVFRTQLQAGNLLILWTDAGSARLALGGVSLNTSAIPKGQPGTGFLTGPAQTRDVMGRVPEVKKKWDAVRAAVPARLDAAGTALLAALDADPEGIPQPTLVREAFTDAGLPDLADAAAALFAGQPATPAPAAVAAGSSITFPAGMVIGDPPADEPLSAAQEKILAMAAEHEVVTPQQMCAALGITDQALRRHLGPLLAGEPPRLVKLRKGQYALPEPDADESAT